MKSRTVLVTGGAGFIGSHLSRALQERGYEVRVLDDLSVGLRENIPSGCQFFCGSILDTNLVRSALSGADAVFHLAARVSIRNSVDRFVEDAETNLTGTLHLLRAAAEEKVRRFVFASSMAVYHDSVQPSPIKENELLEPASPYGVAKLAAERYLFLLSAGLGVEPVVLRYFNTFGTRQGYTPYVGVITIFITRLLQRQNLTIFGDGNQVRDFVHVSDIVQANLLALERTEAAGNVFNIGSGKGTSVRQIADLLMAKLGRQTPVEFLPPLPQELRNSVADISRAQSILGYRPATNLDQQLGEVLEYLTALHKDR